MRRREFVGLLGGVTVAWPLAIHAQIRRPLVAVLIGSSAAAQARYLAGFLQGMKENGYVESRDLDIVYRYADGDLTRTSALAAEIAELHPHVVVIATITAALAIQKVLPAVPIVGAALTDPVSFGLAASHPRPGGQVTGILNTLDTLPGKQLEIAREAIPRANKIGFLANVTNQSTIIVRRDTEIAASALGVKLVPVEVHSPLDIDVAFRTFRHEGADLVLVPQDAMFNSERQRISAAAISARLPIMGARRELVEAGSLMSYGISLFENFRRAASYVDKILKGTKPGDLPIELPTKLELVINLKTAKALDLTVPESFLLRADEVIE